MLAQLVHQTSMMSLNKYGFRRLSTDAMNLYSELLSNPIDGRFVVKQLPLNPINGRFVVEEARQLLWLLLTDDSFVSTLVDTIPDSELAKFFNVDDKGNLITKLE